MLAEIPLPFRSAVSDSEEGKKEERTAEKKTELHEKDQRQSHRRTRRNKK